MRLGIVFALIPIVLAVWSPLPPNPQCPVEAPDWRSQPAVASIVAATGHGIVYVCPDGCSGCATDGAMCATSIQFAASFCSSSCEILLVPGKHLLDAVVEFSHWTIIRSIGGPAVTVVTQSAPPTGWYLLRFRAGGVVDGVTMTGFGPISVTHQISIPDDMFVILADSSADDAGSGWQSNTIATSSTTPVGDGSSSLPYFAPSRKAASAGSDTYSVVPESVVAPGMWINNVVFTKNAVGLLLSSDGNYPTIISNLTMTDNADDHSYNIYETGFFGDAVAFIVLRYSDNCSHVQDVYASRNYGRPTFHVEEIPLSITRLLLYIENARFADRAVNCYEPLDAVRLTNSYVAGDTGNCLPANQQDNNYRTNLPQATCLDDCLIPPGLPVGTCDWRGICFCTTNFPFSLAGRAFYGTNCRVPVGCPMACCGQTAGKCDYLTGVCSCIGNHTGITCCHTINATYTPPQVTTIEESHHTTNIIVGWTLGGIGLLIVLMGCIHIRRELKTELL